MEVAALSEQSRDVWRLLAREGFSVKEAAKRLDMHPNTVSKVKCRVETLIDNVFKMYGKI